MRKFEYDENDTIPVNSISIFDVNDDGTLFLLMVTRKGRPLGDGPAKVFIDGQEDLFKYLKGYFNTPASAQMPETAAVAVEEKGSIGFTAGKLAA